MNATPDVAAHAAAVRWAEELAEGWSLDAHGVDRMVVAGLELRWPLRVEVNNVLRRLALSRIGRSDPHRGPVIGTVVKRLGVDRAVRMLGLRVTRLPAASQTAQRPVMFISEMATPSALDPALAVARRLPPDLVVAIVADARAASPWTRAGHRPHGLTVPLAEERRIIRRASQAIRGTWRDAQRVLPDVPLGGEDVRRDVHDAIGPLVLRSGPWLWVERHALRNAIDIVRPRSIVLTSDQHRIGWLASQVAAERRIPSLVLQHGLPQAKTAYVPVNADRVAVWSEAALDWFVAHGTPPEKLVVTGDPRMEQPVNGRPSDERDRDGSAARPERLLLAFSPGPSEPNERMLAMTLDAIRLLPHARLIVKLHPGSGDWRFVHRDVGRLEASIRSRVLVVHRERLAPLLRWADVTLVLRTTVALESLVAGTPVVAADVGVPSIADLELRDLDLDRAGTATDLAALVRRLADPDERRAWLEIRRDRIERLAGPADARAAERIAQLLLGAAPG